VYKTEKICYTTQTGGRRADLRTREESAFLLYSHENEIDLRALFHVARWAIQGLNGNRRLPALCWHFLKGVMISFG